jgi:hypothetical protein
MKETVMKRIIVLFGSMWLLVPGKGVVTIPIECNAQNWGRLSNRAKSADCVSGSSCGAGGAQRPELSGRPVGVEGVGAERAVIGKASA